jgi:hypothetical protein
VHDYFDILGIPPGACAQEIRRAHHRRAGVSHPDVHDGETRPSPAQPSASTGGTPTSRGDVAIDFVEMSAVVDRMQAAFFTEP